MAVNQIENEFKSILSAIMASLGKVCFERDLIRVYREEEGHDIKFMIHKLGDVSLLNFLQLKCSSFCKIIHKDGYNSYQIMRLSNENSKHMDYMTKCQNRKKRAKMSNYFNNKENRPINRVDTGFMPITRTSTVLKQIQSASYKPTEVMNKTVERETSDEPPKTHENYKNHCEEDCDANKNTEGTTETLSNSEDDSSSSSCSTNHNTNATEHNDFVTDINPIIANPKLLKFSSKIMFEVKIISIISPSEFWVLYSEVSFNSLVDRMTEFYRGGGGRDSKFLISGTKISRGLIVAAKVDSSFYRAEVIEEPDSDEQVCVLFVDIGTCGKIPLDNVYFLHKSFREPVKALQAKLAGTVINDSSEEALDVMLGVVKDRTMKATIRDHDRETDIYEVELDSNSSSMSELLILKGLAERVAIRGNYFAVPVQTW